MILHRGTYKDVHYINIYNYEKTGNNQNISRYNCIARSSKNFLFYKAIIISRLFYLIPYKKLNPKWTADLNVKI